jgi:hypothetical protein
VGNLSRKRKRHTQREYVKHNRKPEGKETARAAGRHQIGTSNGGAAAGCGLWRWKAPMAGKNTEHHTPHTHKPDSTTWPVTVAAHGVVAAHDVVGLRWRWWSLLPRRWFADI